MRTSALLSLALAGRLALASPTLMSSIFAREASPDNQCGATNGGYSCPSASDPSFVCCSQYGWCGAEEGHCGEGCQPEYGTCGTVTGGGGDSGSGDGGDLEGRCGPKANNQVCAANECCSSAGWCGTDQDYCAAPDCLTAFGPACDANKTPGGASTASISRSTLGSVLRGGDGIYPCEKKGTVALTYDDGPGEYTAHLLDLLKQYGFKATFFITGNNNGKGAIDTTSPYPDVIRRMYAEGHQIASHTWSHADLSSLTSDQRKLEMVKNEMALRNILGFMPTYMRPPYSSCSAASGCPADMATLGYHVVYFDLDTSDYLFTTPETIQNAKSKFDGFWTSDKNPANTDALVIAHDIHYQTVYNLTEHMLKSLKTQGYSGVTVGQCLNDPETNWYRDSTGKGYVPSSPPASSAPPAAASTNAVSTAAVSTAAVSTAAVSTIAVTSTLRSTTTITIRSTAVTSTVKAASTTVRAAATTTKAAPPVATPKPPAGGSGNKLTDMVNGLLGLLKGLFGGRK